MEGFLNSDSHWVTLVTTENPCSGSQSVFPGPAKISTLGKGLESGHSQLY